MRHTLQTIGILLLAAGVVVWLVGGARIGFYKDYEEIPLYDPITEIEYSEMHRKFVPGIEPLVAGLILGGSFYAASFLFSQKNLNDKNIKAS